MAENYDITKVGPLSYRDLQKANSEGYNSSESSLVDNLFLGTPNSALNYVYEGYEKSPIQLLAEKMGTDDYYGSSIYDRPVNETEWESMQLNPNEIRALELGTLAKWASGLGKGVSLAGTTFLDGTLGLMYGVGDMIKNLGNKEETGWLTFSRLWDNEISNGLLQWNKAMEQYLPNYRTQEELDNKWYENLGTANFWADSFLKNMGFTVGAFYSGGAINKVLKGVGLLKGSMGALITGSILSGVNEARIEANTNSQDKYDLEVMKLLESYKPLIEAIKNGDDSLVRVDEQDGISWKSSKEQLLLALLERYNQELAKLNEKKAYMGAIDFIANSVFLPLDNLYTYGRLYARGYNNAKSIAGDRITKEAKKKGMEQAAIEEGVAGRIERVGNQYGFDKITTKEAIGKGLKKGLVEGNEEMTQQMFASTSGYMTDYDSPDAYYNALVDPTAENQTNDFLTSVTKGFADSYGNGDLYEQFAVGFLTGITGIPSFGKMNNMDASTYLGKGKSIGLAGGILGELSAARALNIEGQEAVDYVNKYMNKLQENKLHFVQSQAFSNAMSGFAEDKNAFEYKNYEDNDDFAAISRFAKIGRLNDLKELVNQDFENISDEELDVIAKTTSNEDSNAYNGWKNADGSYKSETEDGRQYMRLELAKKQKKISDEIDSYEKHLAEVRGITNNSLTEDLTNELAWLGWKLDRFDERFKNIKKDNQDLLRLVSDNLLNFKDSVDEESEEGLKWIKSLDNLLTFISYLQGAKSSLDLAMRIEANPEAFKVARSKDTFDLFVDESGINYLDYKRLMDNLADAAKIASSYKTFNDRYKEFLDNPSKLVENRLKIDEKKTKVNNTTSLLKTKSKIAESEVSDIVAEMDESDDLASALDEFDFDESSIEDQVALAKLEKAKAIKEKHDKIVSNIDLGILNGSIDAQTGEDAKRMLEASKAVSLDDLELTDTLSEAYNDPRVIYREEDDSVAELQDNPQELLELMDRRLLEAKSLIEQELAVLDEANDNTSELPKRDELEVKRDLGLELLKETGHDSVTPVTPENEKDLQKEGSNLAGLEEIKKKIEELKKAFDSLGLSKLFNLESLSEEEFQLRDAITNVLADISHLILSGASNLEISNYISETSNYKKILTLPNLSNALNNYVKGIRNILGKESKSKQASKVEMTSKEPETNTPSAEELLRTSTLEYDRKYDENELPANSSYQYWMPSTTKVPIHVSKGNYTTPYYEIAKTLTIGLGKDKRLRYQPSQIKRMEAVYKYIEQSQGFNYVDAGEIQVGDNVSFMVDPKLNEEAGEFVILMVDKNNRVIGDIMSENDKTFKAQIGLPEFVERIKKEFNDRKDKESIFISKETSKVDKYMIGKVPYQKDSEPLHSLNEIFTSKDSLGNNTLIPFKLGIAATSGLNSRILATPGRTKSQGQSDLERSILPPLDAKAGQPFLLFETNNKKGRRQLLTVPITIKPFNYDMLNTRIGLAIKDIIVTELPTLSEGKELGFVDKLQELLVLPDVEKEGKTIRGLYVKVDGDNITIINNSNNKSYKGPRNNPDLANIVIALFYDTPIQVSRKYINTTYNGMDYNTMIGEVAQTNIIPGNTHTISNWFTIKPLSEKGESLPAKSPKPIGVNPYRATPNAFTVKIKDKSYSVTEKTYEVTDLSTNKVLSSPEYKEERINIIRAFAFGFMTNLNMSKPYRTEWGYFNPKTFRFEEEPLRVVRSIGLEGGNNTGTTPSEESYRDRIEKLGIIKKNEFTSYITSENAEPMSFVQAEIIRKKARKVFENKGTVQQLHDAITSVAHKTHAPTNTLTVLYNILDAVNKDNLSVDDAMNFLEEHLYIKEDETNTDSVTSNTAASDSVQSSNKPKSITNPFGENTANNEDIKTSQLELPKLPSEGYFSDEDKKELKEFSDSLQGFSSDPIVLNTTDGNSLKIESILEDISTYGESYRISLVPLGTFRVYPTKFNPNHEGLFNKAIKIINNNTIEANISLAVSPRGVIWTPVKITIAGPVAEEYIKKYQHHVKDVEDYKKTGFKDINEATNMSYASMATAKAGVNRFLLYALNASVGKPITSDTVINKVKDIKEYAIKLKEELNNDSLIFNLSNINMSQVDIEIYDREKTPGFKNRALKIYIKDKHELGYFELVKDLEEGYYSVHFKTGNADTKEMLGSTKEQRAILYEQLRNAIPNGAYVSTWGNVSKGGEMALDKVGKGYPKVGEREVKDREGNKINIPIYQKIIPSKYTPITLDNFDENIYITNTSNGMQSVNELREWSKKSSDMRTQETGWHEHNGLTYYIKKYKGGRGNDNLTIWFRNPLSDELKLSIEEWVNTSSRINKEDIIKALTPSKTLVSTPNGATFNVFDKKDRVKASKLLNKKDITDVVLDEDAGLVITTKIEGYPNLQGTITFNEEAGRFDYLVTPPTGFAWTDISKEEIELAHKFNEVSLDEKQKEIDKYIPKELTKEIASEKYFDNFKEAARDYLKKSWGIYYINENTRESNYIEDSNNIPTLQDPIDNTFDNATHININLDSIEKEFDRLASMSKLEYYNGKDTRPLQYITPGTIIVGPKVDIPKFIPAIKEYISVNKYIESPEDKVLFEKYNAKYEEFPIKYRIEMALITEINKYSSFDEAKKHFKELVNSINSEANTNLSEENIRDLINGKLDSGALILVEDLMKSSHNQNILQTSETKPELTEGDLDKLAEEKGLLGNAVRKALWNNLTNELKSLIVNKKGPKLKLWMTGLEAAFDTASNSFNETALKGTVSDFLSRKGKFRREDGHSKVWNSKKELEWMHRVLPNLSTEDLVRIEDGLIKISEEEGGGYAYGKFQDGIITISSKAAKGTLYHEAFHAIVGTLLTNTEVNNMFDAAKEHYGDLSRLNLEENLAEDFRRYVELELTPVIGKVVKLFRTLKHIILNLFDKEPYLNNLFYRINRGKLSSIKSNYKLQIKTIEQHHRDKMMYGNLNEELKLYMRDKGISIEDYNSMSQMEKEVLFRCM